MKPELTKLETEKAHFSANEHRNKSRISCTP